MTSIEISKYAKAYVKKQGVKSNARFHRGQKVLVSMDVKDFFPLNQKIDIFHVFHGLGYTENVSWFMAYLCCLNGELPQGAPPQVHIWSNIIMSSFDKDGSIIGNRKENGVTHGMQIRFDIFWRW
ncbi:MAG: hypothetical protein ACLTOI_00110 [Faecalibacterium sp.]